MVRPRLPGPGVDWSMIHGSSKSCNEPMRESRTTTEATGRIDGMVILKKREDGPAPSTEAFLGLIAAVERAATATRSVVCLEGYPPPSDPRIHRVTFTPDPGVLEVNLPVSSSLAEYVGHVEGFADAARRAGLCTETYQLDGRVAGTGGGNHLTLGGPTPLTSPFITSPRLFGDLLRYFQQHPSLSYLFT